eukprot:1612930-Rhodomonas_salina.10
MSGTDLAYVATGPHAALASSQQDCHHPSRCEPPPPPGNLHALCTSNVVDFAARCESNTRTRHPRTLCTSNMSDFVVCTHLRRARY